MAFGTHFAICYQVVKTSLSAPKGVSRGIMWDDWTDIVLCAYLGVLSGWLLVLDDLERAHRAARDREQQEAQDEPEPERQRRRYRRRRTW